MLASPIPRSRHCVWLGPQFPTPLAARGPLGKTVPNIYLMACNSTGGLSEHTATAAEAAEPIAASQLVRPKRVKRKAEQIDIDLNIKAARAAMKAAAKAVQQAKANQRNEMRRKQRLMKKAAGLSSGDLERIAVMKRCGLFDPTVMMAVPRTDAVPSEESNPTAASASGTVVPIPDNSNPGNPTAVSAARVEEQTHGVNRLRDQDLLEEDDDQEDPEGRD